MGNPDLVLVPYRPLSAKRIDFPFWPWESDFWRLTRIVNSISKYLFSPDRSFVSKPIPLGFAYDHWAFLPSVHRHHLHSRSLCYQQPLVDSEEDPYPQIYASKSWVSPPAVSVAIVLLPQYQRFAYSLPVDQFARPLDRNQYHRSCYCVVPPSVLQMSQSISVSVLQASHDAAHEWSTTSYLKSRIVHLS